MYITLCQFHLLEKEKQRHLQKLPYDLSFASPCLFEALSIKGTGSAFFTSLKVVFMPSTCLAKACFSLQDSSVSTLSWVSAIPMWVSEDDSCCEEILLRFRRLQSCDELFDRGLTINFEGEKKHSFDIHISPSAQVPQIMKNHEKTMSAIIVTSHKYGSLTI